MQGMDAAKEGKMIKAKESKWITKKDKYITKKPIGERESEFEYKKTHQPKESKYITKKQAGGPIKAKKGIFHSTATSMYDKPPGWDVKKISDKTHKKLTKVWKHRETGGWSPAAGKQYKKYLKSLKKATVDEFGLNTTKGGSKTRFPRPDVNKRTATSFSIKVGKYPAIKGKWKSLPPGIKSKSFHFKDSPSSDFLKRRMNLGSMRGISTPIKALAVLKKLGKRTGIGKAVAAATVVAGAYEAGKRKLFTKDKKKKKVDKKSIGGETVIMKSGGGYIDNLL